MENENTQNKKPVMTLLFRKAGDGLITIDLEDELLEQCQQLLGVKTREWLRPVVSYNWDTKELLKNKLKTILDATIVNNTQKEAIYTLVEKTIDEVDSTLAIRFDGDIRDVKAREGCTAALDSAAMRIADPPFPVKE